jgi:hypothetical protein
MTYTARAPRGVILAATGSAYRAMARNAAEGVKRHCSNLPIHLYADAEDPAPCFDRVRLLADPWRRSKIDAMLDAPFDRNLYLDADVFVVADVSDLFQLLDRFDIALAHDQERNGPHGRAIWRRPFPASFPQFNSGVIVFRRCDAVLSLMGAWREAVRGDALPRDQAALRELLWDSDLRIATLPPEFNLLETASVFQMRDASMAPRIVHHYAIHRERGETFASSVAQLHGAAIARAIGFMQGRDHFLGARAKKGGGRIGVQLQRRLLQAWIIADMVARRVHALVATLRGRRGL